MKIILNSAEIMQIQLDMLIRKLPGISFLCPIGIDNPVETLVSKGYMSINDGKYIIDDKIKMVFENWKDANIIVQRPDLSTGESDLFFLSCKELIIVFARNKSEYIINYFTKTIEGLYKTMETCCQIVDKECKELFNVFLETSQTENLFTDKNYEKVSKSVGLSVETLKKFENIMAKSEDFISVNIKSLSDKKRSEVRIAHADDGIYMIKRMIEKGCRSYVLVKGDKKSIINSLFIY